MAWRFDGISNVISRLGFKGDKSRANRPQVAGVNLLTEDELASVWIGDGFGKKLVSIRGEDALAQGWDFPNDKDGKFLKEVQRLKVLPTLKNALQWADLFGGALILPMVEDGSADLSTPKPARAGAPVTQLRVYDRSRVWSISTSWVNDQNSPYFEDVEVFTIRKLDGTPFKVHATRVHIIKGEPVPQNTYISNIDLRWWGQSFLQPIFQDVAAYGTAFQAITHLMQESSVAKFRFPEITALLSQGTDGENKVMKRMELINYGKSVVRAVFMGEGEEYVRENIPMGDIASALRVFQEHACAVCGFPLTRVFGTSPGGLNATGESDMNNHYDRIREYQTFTVRPIAEPILKAIALGMGLPESVADFEFKPLGAPTQAQLVDMRAKQATTDVAYMTAGVLTEDEVRENRFFKRASLETVVTTAAAPEKEEPLDLGMDNEGDNGAAGGAE